MALHGRANVSATNPRAFAICQRCGFLYNLDQLSWQYQFVGVTLQNLRILVCPTCLDTPSEQLRQIILPVDPVPMLNARPENYVSNNNPLSPIGVDANFFTPQYGSRIGNLTGGGGINAPFDGNVNKQSWLCANNTISNSSYNNYVGINWTGNVSQLSMPSSLLPPTITHTVTSFTAYAPLDRGFLGSQVTSYVVQTSAIGDATWGSWTTISSGTTSGVAGESISGDCTGSKEQFHRIAFLGDQLNYVAIAQLSLNVAETE